MKLAARAGSPLPAGSLVALMLLGVLCLAGCGPRGDSPHKVYVLLGLHSNFYHSWRGDSPDEAGVRSSPWTKPHITEIGSEVPADSGDSAD